ncbi:hypothetical protein [uncultured Desulfuromusa sp.]|uniref:hypothetical protein n=1 Tax=uncultured Desulfuromusa sp. TaxID=219183 RepID=UPI002AA6274D|nr:hypothetical protein [uncultured Desulfuromusa sp.]
MSKKNIYRLVAVFIALTITGVFMLCDLGANFTPLTKLFVIFFGGIIGLQCVPAALLFVSMVRGVFKVNQNNSLTENGVKS